MKLDSKTIEYRGGVVSFEIPSSWKEEYEPKGGGTFYEDRSDSGTLRLNVLSFSQKDSRSSEDILRMLMAKDHQEVLSCGFPVKIYTKVCEENGESLHLYRWDISVPVPPASFNVVCFSYTIVSGQETDPRIKEELRMISHMVRTARFSTAQSIAGDFAHETKD